MQAECHTTERVSFKIKSCLRKCRKSDSCLPGRRSGLFQKQTQDQRDKDAIQQRCETSLVMSQAYCFSVAVRSGQPRAKNGTGQRAETEINKIKNPGGRACELRWVGFLHNGGGQHSGARRNSH